ncbi:glutathione S-transferase-like isoform X2 [Magnolia sinica]|uniref:glutathione S-transferase-like isoform X2 n=1 Tax=Magnolia sinica TaxID=86752 RepID=UPI002658A6F8|nr:glutathione S-transferase-like isoform X2 [Magnolia sinica]
MAVPKVYGEVLSTAMQRVLACLYEKHLEYELVPVNMAAGDHKKEPFLSLNPFGQVPAFEDGDLKLFESRAITQYVAHSYPEKGTELIYQDPKRMATIGMWMEVEAHHFDPVASKLVRELIFKPMFGMAVDSALVTEYEAKLSQVLDVYESRLEQNKYLGGDYFSLADLHHLPCMQCLMGTPVKELFYARVHVGAWCNDLLDRPAWNKVIELTNDA